ncbi:hypothetical protein SDC9_59343 [bioreactor metagenome]|uniref:HTH cro/C1-type domain-containing protein n=1 Tax=bioreactor metagenome TaxID=1076179 RepID=A0A644XB57_9ZZZZ|nr:helix-turn-helix transcriptional regulator [Rikenellaceae bacterium]
MKTRRKPSTTLTRIMASLDEATLRRTRDRMLVASKISDILKAKNISQRKFSEMLGKCESEISEMLSGNRNFTVDTLSDISNCLKVDIMQLSFIPTTRISKHDILTKVPKKRRPKIYDMNNVKSISLESLGWQSYSLTGCISLAF